MIRRALSFQLAFFPASFLHECSRCVYGRTLKHKGMNRRRSGFTATPLKTKTPRSFICLHGVPSIQIPAGSAAYLSSGR